MWFACAIAVTAFHPKPQERVKCTIDSDVQQAGKLETQIRLFVDDDNIGDL
jgi:hypothetical protein